MDQQINFQHLIAFLGQNFFHIPTIAIFLLLLLAFFIYSAIKSYSANQLLTPSKFAPSIMTATGLLGTFIGLSFGLKDLDLQNQTSMQELINGLKLVFVYSLFGVGSSIIFMLINLVLSKRQIKFNQELSDKTRQQAKNYNLELLELQKNQASSLKDLSKLQEKSVSQQEEMEKHLNGLKFENDNERLAAVISSSIISGLAPILKEIKEAVADQGTEAIKKVLEDLKEEILIPMKGALDNTNDALKTTNQAVKDTIAAIEESQKHNNHLIAEVGSASEKMKNASESMNGLVDSVAKTVNHMDEIQVKQHTSLEQFNNDLQENLAKIQPAIQEGLSTAGRALSEAISTATISMKNGIEDSLKSAGDKLNETVDNAFNQFSKAQDKFDNILDKFSSDMNSHLDRMATELEEIGVRAESIINSASNNLEKTLGDIDDKLLNTAETLKVSLETFRIEYQNSLTLYLNEQTNNLNGFLDRQNEQLEQTIGKQREGLVEVTNELTQQFKFMSDKQVEINNNLSSMLSRIDAIQTTILPKVQEIAKELSSGEQKLSKSIEESSKYLDEISKALTDMGHKLPTEFEKAFELLNKKYTDAFKDLDRGLADSINTLGSVIGTIDKTTKGLVQAITIDDALRKN